MPEAAVLVEFGAMVASQDDERLLVEADAAQLLEHAADFDIHGANRPVIPVQLLSHVCGWGPNRP